MQLITLAVGFFAALSAAQNAFTYPTTGDVLTAGETSTLTWDATTNGTVSLRLQWGAKTTSSDGVAIATAIDNSGSYDWDVPSAIPVEADYFIYIVDDDDTDITNYSARFSITGVTGSSTTSSSTVASSTTSVASTSTAASNTATTTSTTSSTSSTSTSSSSTTASSTTLMTSSSSAAPSSSTAVVATTTAAKTSSAVVSSATAPAASIVNNGVDAVKAPSMMLGVFGLVAFAFL